VAESRRGIGGERLARALDRVRTRWSGELAPRCILRSTTDK
jgi:hypothetical protein